MTTEFGLGDGSPLPEYPLLNNRSTIYDLRGRERTIVRLMIGVIVAGTVGGVILSRFMGISPAESVLLTLGSATAGGYVGGFIGRRFNPLNLPVR